MNSKMYKQTDDKYKTLKMGNGSGTIHDFGCYLTSLCNGLNRFGWSFTPESLNEFFGSDGTNRPVKTPNAWVGPYKNYIDVDNLNKYFPNIFTSYQRIDPWNDAPTIQSLIKPDRVILGRVSAIPIGGTGDHFVLIVDIQDGVVVIHDPWSGKTEKITVRWSKYGNILGLRVFDIKPYTTPPPDPDPVDDNTLLDLSPLGKEPDGTPYRVESFGTVKAKIKAKDQSLTNLSGQVALLVEKNTLLTNENSAFKTENEALNTRNGTLKQELETCQNSHDPVSSKVPVWIRRLFGDRV